MTAGLREHIDEVAAEHSRITRREDAGETIYEIGDEPIAAVHGPTIAFRLRADMVAAALRTPGTGPSSRGSEWVSFEPAATPDRYEVDRLRSWFEMAARLAGG